MKIFRLRTVAVAAAATAAVLTLNTTSATATPNRDDPGILSSTGVTLSGDWNGDGVDTPGFYANGLFLLRDSNTSGGVDIEFQYGDPGETGFPVVGDWDGDGFDTVGLVRGDNWLL